MGEFFHHSYLTKRLKKSLRLIENMIQLFYLSYYHFKVFCLKEKVIFFFKPFMAKR